MLVLQHYGYAGMLPTFAPLASSRFIVYCSHDAGPLLEHYQWSAGCLHPTGLLVSFATMLLYFLFYVLYSYVEAVPICIDRAETAQESNSPLQRTLAGIVWSCVSTIIICAWTSVHPNVPPPNPWKARWNRLRLMFWMIIAPELVLAWAVRQFFAAKEIRDEYNNRYPSTW